MPTIVACPHCGKEVVWGPESAWRPFCSKRCKLCDLGDWLNETHRISEPLGSTDAESEADNWSEADQEDGLPRH
ncbi:DNA gyrase inhibitor YacG [Halochromatium roseum]|uniref:DNA gyrase inhibitor YacG n=1 Tax=Halochromatium roseum TaxID=391920 RepID=UPI0019136565|nr:DNA gyrase inhibitor YacG [Halochromatium roseum]MBK5938488.1 hypothetical protein [Halochromatium roseum]